MFQSSLRSTTLACCQDGSFTSSMGIRSISKKWLKNWNSNRYSGNQKPLDE
jgi:hypothetical protein